VDALRDALQALVSYRDQLNTAIAALTALLEPAAVVEATLVKRPAKRKPAPPARRQLPPARKAPPSMLREQTDAERELERPSEARRAAILAQLEKAGHVGRSTAELRILLPAERGATDSQHTQAIANALYTLQTKKLVRRRDEDGKWLLP
jgi:hypothetical protein